LVQFVGDGYLEKYIDIFVNNYITIFRRLTSVGVNYEDIAEPRIVYVAENDTPGSVTENAILKLEKITGKKLVLICDKHKYTSDTVMYSTRNRLRLEIKKAYPTEKKVYFYFPIDDNIRPEIATELYKLAHETEPTACMFKFMVVEGAIKYSAGTRPICSWRDIHPGDWGGYCAYNILDEEKCPLYPKIAIPNIAFYTELYKAGYKQYPSKEICIDHLRHRDSHHFKTKDTTMTENVRKFLLEQIEDLKEKGYK
jgi:hypothetical protein